MARRRLTGDEKTKFANVLKSYPDAVGIVVVSALLDPESSDFADDFESALHDASWKTLRSRDRLTSKTGISLGTLQGTPEIDPFKRPFAGLKQRIGKALDAIGVTYHDVTFGEADRNTIAMEFKPGVIYLVVEHKPLLNGPDK